MPGILQLAEILDSAADARRRSWQGDLGAGSPAAGELDMIFAEINTREPLERLIVLADLWTLIAAEQLGAMASLMRTSQHLIGLLPIARSVIEHAAATLWVLAPQLTTPKRGARAALAARKSAEETCTAMAHLQGKGSEDHIRARQSLKQLRQKLHEEFDLNAGDERSIFGEELAGPTDMVAQIGTATDQERLWQGMYDYLCAAANHPTLRVFDFIDLESDRPAIEISDAFVERLVRACLEAFLRALDAALHYYGWDSAAVDQVYERANRLFSGHPVAS